MQMKITFALVTLALILPSSWVGASPWTLPKDELGLSMRYDFEQARQEYLSNGTFQAYPLEGQFYSNTVRLEARYGFTDRLEGAIDVSFRHLNFDIQPIVIELPEDTTDRGAVNESILDFGSSKWGVADVQLHTRYNLRSGLVMVTTETSLKLPSGYTQPEGTFVEESDGSMRVAGDATLGDGQADITQSLLLGAYIPPTKTFVRFDVGAKARFGAPGPQGVGALRVGQFLTDTVIVMGGARFARTMWAGESIGVTMVARDPSVLREDFTGENVVGMPLYLDRDYFTAEAGLILRLEPAEVQFSYAGVMWGRNMAALHSVGMAVSLSLPSITGP
ncbi:MAG: hypothetical protein ACNA8W_08220 [Bradymonadaceae bacterium]